MDFSDEPSLIRLARESGTQDRPQPVDLAIRVRELRKQREWTLEQAAQKAGLARSTLSKIENGQMSPTYDALKKLADGLDISVPQLFTPRSMGVLLSPRPARESRTRPRPMNMKCWRPS